MKRVKVTVTVPEASLPALLETLGKNEWAWTVIKPETIRASVQLAAVAYRLLEQGHGVRDISQRTGLSKSTVSRIGRYPEKYKLAGKEPIGRGIGGKIDDIQQGH